nr:hypothetical protein [Tanacetum cinerariifolium]
MNPVAALQVSLDNALVSPKKRLKIEKCNARIEFSKPQREETYQVTLDALKLSSCYPIFLSLLKDTLGVSVSKKQASTEANRGKGMDLLSEAALLKATQLKKTLKKSKLETHKLHASGSGDGVGSQPKGDSDDDSNDHESDDVTNDDDDDVDSDADSDNEASDSEKTDSDEDDNPNLN